MSELKHKKSQLSYSSNTEKASPPSEKGSFEDSGEQSVTQKKFTEDGKIIVDWDGPDDKFNPKNWSVKKKLLTTILISLCSTTQYMGAAIYTPAEPQTQAVFHTSEVRNMLGLTLFVWGYGLGSLWFSPMSEIPIFRGRTPTYLACQFIFAILQIPTALVNHVAPFAVLRFLAGIFASPPLATAGATLGDIYDFPALGVALAAWSFASICGPFLGPLIGAALVQHHPWRYVFWFLLAISGGFFIIMCLFLSETNPQEILIRKARRLRKESGSDRYIAPGEILAKKQKVGEVLKQMFYRPIKITIMEPILLLMDIHIGLVYSILYLYFEAFPIVYVEMRHWNLVKTGLAFMPFIIGIGIAAVFYLFYMYKSTPKLAKPESVFGPSAILGSILLPIGVLVWGWLQRSNIHWVIGMIGNILFAVACFLLFQSYFSFIGVMFPPNVVGSAFASNNIVRSLMGGAFPLFGTVFYKNTAIDRYPVGWGCTILACIALFLIPLPIYITMRGGKLREYAQAKYGADRYTES